MSHNIEWHAVVSLLEAVGTVTTHHDHKVEVTVGDGQAFIDPPSGKDIDPQTVVDFLKARNPRQHVVLTGRGAPPAIVEAADLVSEVVPVKHPYKSGIKAQQGIEF